MTGRGGVDALSRPLQDDSPWRHRLRPDLCPHVGHPGSTYNPIMDATWCLCGARRIRGNAVQRTSRALGPAHCGGVLSECLGPEETRHPCPEVAS